MYASTSAVNNLDS